MDDPAIPLTFNQQAKRFVEEMKGASGPEMAEHARGMLTSSNAVVRGVGAVMLAEAGGLDAERMKAIAEDKELSVPLFALQWLTDSGREAQAADLRGLLQSRGISSETLMNMLAAADLNGGGERAALDLLRAQMSNDEAADLYAALARDEAQNYPLRMKAAVDMRAVVPFETYRSTIAGLQVAVTNNDPAWDEGVRRLNERLQGPAEVLQAPPTLSSSDVDEMLAREHPMMLEDLALQVEYLVGHTNSTVSPGTVAHLTGRLKSLRNQPLTDDDQAAIARLDGILPRVAAIEQDRPAPAVEVPPGSSGGGQPGGG